MKGPSTQASIRALRRMCSDAGIEAEMIRTRKHMVWELRAPDGRVQRMTLSVSPSCPRTMKNVEKGVQRFAKGGSY